MRSQPFLKTQVQIMLFAIIFKTMLTDSSLSPTNDWKMCGKKTFSPKTMVQLHANLSSLLLQTAEALEFMHGKSAKYMGFFPSRSLKTRMNIQIDR